MGIKPTPVSIEGTTHTQWELPHTCLVGDGVGYNTRPHTTKLIQGNWTRDTAEMACSLGCRGAAWRLGEQCPGVRSSCPNHLAWGQVWHTHCGIGMFVPCSVPGKLAWGRLTVCSRGCGEFNQTRGRVVVLGCGGNALMPFHCPRHQEPVVRRKKCS